MWIRVYALSFAILVVAACSETKRTKRHAEPVAPAVLQVCCDASAAPRPERDASPMCHVPAGSFDIAIRPDEDPPMLGRVTLSRDFYMDQYEVTNEAFARFLRETGNRCGEEPCYVTRSIGGIETTSGAFDVIAPDLPRHPAIVHKHAARAYCAWAGKRLPTDAEWEYAARYDPVTKQSRTFVWGDAPEEGAANIMFAIEPGRGRLAEGGAFPRDRSAVGVYDLGGNAYEWVEDCYREILPCAGGCVDPVNVDVCDDVCFTNVPWNCTRAETVRGGGILHGPPAVPAAQRRAADARWERDGFRCAR